MQEAFDESAQLEAIERAEVGLPDSLVPKKPIIGIPASYLLSMLDANA